MKPYPELPDSRIWIEAMTFGDFCPGDPSAVVTRAFVITFDRPMDLDRIVSSDGRCCG